MSNNYESGWLGRFEVWELFLDLRENKKIKLYALRDFRKYGSQLFPKLQNAFACFDQENSGLRAVRNFKNM